MDGEDPFTAAQGDPLALMKKKYPYGERQRSENHTISPSSQLIGFSIRSWQELNAKATKAKAMIVITRPVFLLIEIPQASKGRTVPGNPVVRQPLDSVQKPSTGQ